MHCDSAKPRLLNTNTIKTEFNFSTPLQLPLILYSSTLFLFPVWSWAPSPCWNADTSIYNFIAAEKPQEDESGSCCQSLGEGWKVMRSPGWAGGAQNLQACGLKQGVSQPCSSLLLLLHFTWLFIMRWKSAFPDPPSQTVRGAPVPSLPSSLCLDICPALGISSLPLFSSAVQTHPKWSMWSYSYAEQWKKSPNGIWCESELKSRETI